MGILGFTDMSKIGVTIDGGEFDRRLYNFRLAWSECTMPTRSGVARVLLRWCRDYRMRCGFYSRTLQSCFRRALSLNPPCALLLPISWVVDRCFIRS